MSKIESAIQTLIEELKEAKQKLSLLQFDDDDYSELCAPCSEVQLRTVTADLGMPLPPTYEAFLRLHNGWTEFIGEASLLSVEDRQAPWYAARVKGIHEHLKEFGHPDFLDNGFLIAVHPDVSSLLYLDKSKPTEGGDLETVYYSLIDGEIGRYPSFKALLEYWLSTVNKLIEEEQS